MDKEFANLYRFVKEAHKYSTWAQQCTIEQRAIDVKAEVDELLTELERKNMPEFKKELGDVFWDVLCLIAKAEEEGLVDVKELLQNVHEKFKQRKPFVQEKRKATAEEEERIWREVKKREQHERHKTR